MKIAVLFDGAGLARLGLEQAGHDCTGFELDPLKHHLSKFVGSGNCILEDVENVDLEKFDGVWASPPCTRISKARYKDTKPRNEEFTKDYLNWCLLALNNPLWIENVFTDDNSWGTKYNAAQFLENPIQCRNRIVGGTYIKPKLYREYKRYYKEFKICPVVLATEYKGSTRKATKWYGRIPTIEECAYHQGFEIPKGWNENPSEFKLTDRQWEYNLYEAIGNGVPVYMSRAFGEAYK